MKLFKKKNRTVIIIELPLYNGIQDECTKYSYRLLYEADAYACARLMGGGGHRGERERAAGRCLTLQILAYILLALYLFKCRYSLGVTVIDYTI